METDLEKTKPDVHQGAETKPMNIPPELAYTGNESTTSSSSDKETSFGEVLAKKVNESLRGFQLHDSVNDRLYTFVDVDTAKGEHFGKLRFRDVTDGESDVIALISEKDIRWDTQTGSLQLGEGWELLPVIDTEQEATLEKTLDDAWSPEVKSPRYLSKLTEALREPLSKRTIRSTGDHKEFEFVEVVFSSDERSPYKIMLRQSTDEDNIILVSQSEFDEQFRLEETGA